MTEDANQEFVRRWTEDGYGKGKVDHVEELFDPELINQNPMPGQPAGRDGAKVGVMMLRSAFSELRIEFDVVIAGGDWVVVRDGSIATHTGQFGPIPSTGKQVSVDRIAGFRLQGALSSTGRTSTCSA
jgi:predicted ester cyclase